MHCAYLALCAFRFWLESRGVYTKVTVGRIIRNPSIYYLSLIANGLVWETPYGKCIMVVKSKWEDCIRAALINRGYSFDCWNLTFVQSSLEIPFQKALDECKTATDTWKSSRLRRRNNRVGHRPIDVVHVWKQV